MGAIQGGLKAARVPFGFTLKGHGGPSTAAIEAECCSRARRFIALTAPISILLPGWHLAQGRPYC